MRKLSAALALSALVLLAGCGKREPDLVNGKALFVERCGACHALKRAGTQGTTGPSLDAAFAQARRDGMDADTIAGVVRYQIAHPRRGSAMPANLVTGRDAEDVAAYVAHVAAVRGEDQGLLAQAGLAGARDGRQIFTAAGCGGCHALARAGTNGTVGPRLDDLAAAARRYGRQRGQSPAEYVRESIVDPDAFVTPGFRPGVMPKGYGQRLSREQVDALVSFLLGR